MIPERIVRPRSVRALGWALAGAVALAAGCAGARARPAQPLIEWRGNIRVETDVTIPRGSRLVLEPGTVVRFARRDDDGDGWGDASLRIEGDLTALGTPEAPVVFTSEAEPAEPGAWGEIRVDFGSFDLRYTVIEGSTRGLHAHFAKGRVEDSVFRRNVDGTRLGQSSVVVENCLFYDHSGKALNQRMSRNQVRRNLFRHNRNGIFLFDGDEGSAFEGNVFRDNEHPFRLGDFFEGTARALGNDWGGAPPSPDEAGADGTTSRFEATAAVVQEAGPRNWRAGLSLEPRRVEGLIASASAAWSGEIRVTGPVVVPKDVTLTLQPGTRVSFDLPEPAADTDPKPWILVLGTIEAEGSASEPIVFTSAGRRNEIENMIDVREGARARFRSCIFEKGPWGLHLHEAKADVEACVFRGNYGGVRFKGGDVRLRENRFEENEIGVRCWKASPAIDGNTFVRNRTGIFFREQVEGAFVRGNRFENDEYDVKLGEMQTTDVDARGNWWKAAGTGFLQERIFDGADSEGVGRVITEPALKPPEGLEVRP